MCTPPSIPTITPSDSWLCALARIVSPPLVYANLNFASAASDNKRGLCIHPCRGTYHETQPIVLCTAVTISCFSACDAEADHVMKEEENTPEQEEQATTEACSADSESEPHLSTPAVQEAAKAGGAPDTCPPSHPLFKNPPKVNIGA